MRRQDCGEHREVAGVGAEERLSCRSNNRLGARTRLAIAIKIARDCCPDSTYQVNDSGYSCDVRIEWGVYMSRAHWTAGVRDDAIIAFLLFCLEVYQAEQQRKRTLH